MMRVTIFTILVISSCLCFADESIESTALSMIPRGKISRNKAPTFIIKTLAGTEVELAFKKDGKFKTAKGSNLGLGDDCEPGMGLISLSSAARGLNEFGHKVLGKWKLNKDSNHGWVYELNAAHTQEVIHLVNAASGHFIGTLAKRGRK